MSNVAKLKKKAAELELKKQPDKAFEVYLELLKEFEKHPEEMDIALYNRVGDLLLRQGNVADAIDYYEQAVDHYAEGGFYNNAIALCNKILRNSPGRTTVYYKLGKISAQKGFKADAKVNFLEYADRVQKTGNLDEAFRALKEFADLCPDQDDIRLMLADQLSKADKKGEAIEQLQLLYARYHHEGRSGEAEATYARMKAIDPDAEPAGRVSTSSSSGPGGLVFLDLDAPPTPAARASRMSIAVEKTPEPSIIEPVIEVPPPAEAGTLMGLETTSFDMGSPPAAEAPELLDLEPTSMGEQSSPDLPMMDLDEASDSSAPAESHAPASGGLEFMDLGEPSVSRSSRATHRDDIAGGDLDLIVPDVPEPTPRSSEPVSLGDALLDFEPADGMEIPASEPARSSGSSPTADLPMLDDLEEGSGPELEFMSLGNTGEQDVIPSPTTPSASAEPLELADDDGLMDFEIPSSAPASRPSVEIPPLEMSDVVEELPMLEVETAPPQLTSAPRPSTMLAARGVAVLEAVVEGEPDDWSARQQLGEAMLEAGNREGGLQQLEQAMATAEKQDDLDGASSLAEELVRIDPATVKHHQKRVEYAFRRNEKGRLVEAYLSLADALYRNEQVEKSRAIYERVLELAPDDLRAQAAVASLAPAPVEDVSAAPAAAAKGARPDDDFVNLGDWLRDDAGPKDTRMVVQEQEPTGDEQADFADMLKKFKEGVAENVDEGDYQSHYDLGVAFKEMGLLDEAIGEFQKALRGKDNRVRTYEAIGSCFIEKEQYQMGSTILGRALAEPGMGDDQLVGVLYLMGRSAEAQGKPSDAVTFYQRVFVVDIQFQDVADRLAAVENAAR
ncbi:MAG: hypothetical protein JWO05_2052 [Gemmatimonadetes bacterium]|nr:hypothetical protein [Gemmatimonadota bacterium]